MEKQDVLDILSEIGENEHDWVDFKEDYHIGGEPHTKAEFIRDIASFANTILSQSERYIFVGVCDNGEIVGVSDDSTEKQSVPRHIFSYDESDIQETADGSLEPCPNFSFHTYQHNDDEFGVLVVYPMSQAPCVTAKDINNSEGDRILHRGLIYVRKGSRKKVARHEEIEGIIQDRIENRREDILENVGKIVSLGPDAIDQLGTQVTDDGIAVTPSEDSGIGVQERLTRDPASTLDGELNGDIASWASRGEFLSQKATWEYYSNPEELRIDGEAVQFLTISALINSALGIFWLAKNENRDYRKISNEIPHKHHTIERAASVFVLMGDSTGLSDFLEQTSTTAEYGKLSKYPDVVSDPLEGRVDHIVESRKHELEYNSWSAEFDVTELEREDLEAQISEVAGVLTQIYDDSEKQRTLLWKSGEFRESIADLEASLARFVFDD